MNAVPAGDRRAVTPLRAAAGRCPACGEGDLFHLRITRREGEWRGAYCAGTYDHDRRRFVRRGCGYAADTPAGGEEPAGGASREPDAGGRARV